MMPDSPSLRSSSGGSHSSYRLPRRVFVGSLVSPQTLLSINVIKTAVVGVGTSGVIRFVEDLDDHKKKQETAAKAAAVDRRHPRSRDTSQEDDRSSTPVPIPDHDHKSFLSEQIEDEQSALHEVVAKHGWELQQCELVRLGKNSFLCPGFIDTHTHAPQVPNLGLGQQYELLDWLQYVTFPRERKFEDPIYARKTYESVIERMLNSGTTCAAIYATLHEEATMILADICNQKGLRALVGKCQMDRNSPVDYVEKNPSASMEATRNFINYCRALKPYDGTEQTVQEDGMTSPSATSADASDSPEMTSSIARLKVTMNEMIDGDKGASHEEGTESPSSSSNHDAASTRSSKPRTSVSSLTSPPSRSNSFHHQQKTHSMHRHGSLSSSTSSLNGGRAKSSSQSNNGYDSPKRQKERQHNSALVQPILTPRFAISCSDALLTSISAMMSRDPSLRIQTHLSENEGEIAFTKKLFPFTSCYTELYDHFSLLTPRTILAHAIHLDDEEMKLIGKRKCGISHCPTSNNNLRSGVSRVGEMLNRGIKVGLGTDMSGGFGLSILSAIREASVVAKVLNFKSLNSSSGQDSNGAKDEQRQQNTPPPVGNQTHHTGQVEVSGSPANKARVNVENYDFCNGPLSVATLFYLATLGGAEVCNLAHRVGSLEAGKEFDALLINTANGCPNLYIEDEDEVEEKLEKFLFCGDDRNIASVFVRGRVVGGSSPI